MKKLLFFVPLYILVCLSCGLETFYDMKPPKDAVPQNAADGIVVLPPIDTASSRKFEFTAVKNDGFTAWGTEVYYRIYNSLEKLQSDAKSINAVNADKSVDGFYKLQSLAYKRLRTEKSDGKQDLLIERDGRVTIRLRDEGLGVGAIYTGTVLPVFRENNMPFYFGAPEGNQKPPEAGNSDFTYTDAGENMFYVNAYAVSTGLQSASWTRAVSKVLPLGFCVFRN
ncbi:hypothetical protein V1L52_05340 [Treponema sp. HNW]|uniref:hypothetical protein n=1 Tax=Treponema sp. HNW TaxID=3116654 RepID=UPI003D0E395C